MYPDPNTEMVSKTQVPSHVAEFVMPTKDYPALLGEFDRIASKFKLRRYKATPGLNELHGREVLFAVYGSGSSKLQNAALNVMDIDAPGEVLLWVYDDYFPDPETRENFIATVHVIVQRHGGKLVPNPR